MGDGSAYPQIEDTVKCPECNSRSLERDESRGEVVCQDCGLVIEDNVIDQGAEWRVFSPEQGDQRARTGAPMTVMLHDKGLSTDIDWQNKDYSGKTINSRYRSQFYRMRKWQKRSRVSNAAARAIVEGSTEIDELWSCLELPESVREEAAVNYKKAVEKGLIRGRSIEGVAAASLYAACRQLGVPRTLDEIGQASRTGRKEISRTYRFMVRELKMKIGPTGPEDYISQYLCSPWMDLEVKKCEVQKSAEDLIISCHQHGLAFSGNPQTWAAASVFVAARFSGIDVNLYDFASTTGVKAQTLLKKKRLICRVLALQGI